LLIEIKKHNSILDLIFEGDFRKIEGNSFGFFKNISHQNGATPTYPVSNDLIDEIFIPSGELSNGKRYSFEATIARRNERTKKANPFLLQARSENIKEIIELSAISQELKVKQEKLEEINTYLEKAEQHFEEKKEEIEEKVSKVFQEKQSEANEIIETYQEIINHKFNEIQNKEKELSSLNQAVEATNNHLQKMENLLSTLKERVSLCRNLQFISEDDENKYLNLLSAKEFKPENHHDFEKDFENNFSKLSEHIHAYLYHKKNLIYTRYQIKNFLTLLKTHDIIVLSGLSGSGKTQIIKAFAEALGGVAKIIPVKPNWTSSDDLIGYYNPLQMSFLPTPFTEAIVEAINNPNQLFFICLDEMNLARAEYYFADFLSKLEERSKLPEIELYAGHEEELFVSEFSTLLNLIESSINGKTIKSWQEFLDNEEARKKFFEMLGNTDKESMLQLHSKMKRRLIDILKFPSTIRIPENVRFIGAINVDETTHYFSPKILDRIHVVKFDNPLLFEEQVNSWFKNTKNERELLPVYVNPIFFPKRMEYPPLRTEELSFIEDKLKRINQTFLIPIKIDFGIRSIRQALNYYNIIRIDEKRLFTHHDEDGIYEEVLEIEFHETLQALNTTIIQKILPRFIFDGNEIVNSGKTKADIIKEFCNYLKDDLTNYMTYDSDGSPDNDVGFEIELNAYSVLNEMINNANHNSQFNFFA
jgi:MoxR-like ATPase/rubrerythrin